jgi:ATP-dependent Clp protease ATP-binding subunit ClpC
MNYNFTDRVRVVLAMAREEAVRLQHDYVGTEHVLFGILREGQGVAAEILKLLVGDLAPVLRALEGRVTPGRANTPIGELPYTTGAKQVLELAMTESRRWNHSYVGTEHMLLGLLEVRQGLASEVLDDFGVRLDAARDEMLRLLGSDDAPGRRFDPEGPGPPPGFVDEMDRVIARMEALLADLRRLRDAAIPPSEEDDGSAT